MTCEEPLSIRSVKSKLARMCMGMLGWFGFGGLRLYRDFGFSSVQNAACGVGSHSCSFSFSHPLSETTSHPAVNTIAGWEIYISWTINENWSGWMIHTPSSPSSLVGMGMKWVWNVENLLIPGLRPRSEISRRRRTRQILTWSASTFICKLFTPMWLLMFLLSSVINVRSVATEQAKIQQTLTLDSNISTWLQYLAHSSLSRSMFKHERTPSEPNTCGFQFQGAMVREENDFGISADVCQLLFAAEGSGEKFAPRLAVAHGVIISFLWPHHKFN